MPRIAIDPQWLDEIHEEDELVYDITFEELASVIDEYANFVESIV